MSSGGGTVAAAPVPITPKPKAPPRRKLVTENWDDDFEFSLPAKPRTAPVPAPVATTPKRERGPFLAEGRGNGLVAHDSPDSFDEDWDDPLPGPSRTPSTRSAKRPPRSPVVAAHAHLHPPRSSPSHSPTLPSPTASSSSYKAVGFPSRATSSTSLATARPGPSGESTSRPLLSKRSSTTSFTPARQGDLSPSAAHKQLPSARSSPNLADRASLPFTASSSPIRRGGGAPPLGPGIDLTSSASPRKRHSPTRSVPSDMPYPFPSSGRSSPVRGFPSPVKRTPNSTKTSTSAKSIRSSASSPAMKPSPSVENIREKRPSFWKRLSGGPLSSKDSSPDKSPGRRRRSSSVGAGLMTPSDEPIPPLPPLPANLRSPNASGLSSPQRLPSGTSVHSGSEKSKSKRIAAAFMMRRSSSNMSYAVESPSKPGAVPHRGVITPTPQVSKDASSPPLEMSPASSTGLYGSPVASPLQPGREPAARKSSGARRFSPGFHLPSPSPGSPYSRVDSPSSLMRSEGEADDQVNDKSRQRVRPVSAVPSQRRKEGSLTLNASASSSVHSFASTAATSAPRTVHMPTLEALSKRSPSSRQPSATSYQQKTSPTSMRSVSSTQTSNQSRSVQSSSGLATLRRLTSFSRKHGRRLSGGWKFGTGSSSSSHEQQLGVPNLATVEGSPSKPGAVDSTLETLVRPKSAFPGDSGLDIPSSVLSNGRSNRRSGIHGVHHLSDSPPHRGDTSLSRATRERRRLSFNDFVIPDQVLAKQKELKRGIGAVKKFAGGVQSLKQLVAAHDMVCDNVLATGTHDDMKLFVSLEDEYTQWWEMATVLIEVGSTGTDNAAPAVPLRTRRITLATDDARAAGEALSASMSNRGVSYSTIKSFGTDASSDVFGPASEIPSLAEPPGLEGTGKHDLSRRQLEVLRTMLSTPVSASDSVVATVDERQAIKARMRQSMPVAPTKAREVLPSGPATVRATNGPMKDASVQKPTQPPARQSSPEPTYVVPSGSYPSPETASQFTQSRTTRGGLAGLRAFLRSLTNKDSKGGKGDKDSKGSHDSGATPRPKAKSRRPISQPARRRPAPINTRAAAKFGHSPPASPLASAGSHDPVTYGSSSVQSSDQSLFNVPVKTEKKRRPSLKNIFRPSSGNWHELVRGTPPGSPLPTIPAQGTPDEPKTSIDGAASIVSSTPSRTRSGSLARPPSIPAFARLKLTKPYGTISVDTPTASPTKTPRHRASVGQLGKGSSAAAAVAAASANGLPKRAAPSDISTPPVPPVPGTQTPPLADSEATLRLKSRIRGLGHPSEASPSRASSSPARTAAPPFEHQLQVPDGDAGAPRSRSEGGVRVDPDEAVIALTPENLPVLLDYVKQCEKKLQEWRVRAVSLEKPLTVGASAGAGVGAGAGAGAGATPGGDIMTT